MYLVTNKKEECCGCSACQQICNVNAISIIPDEEGFLFPIKNKDICTNCGACEKVCPFEHPIYFQNSPKVLAAYLKNSSEIKKSSSGAIFYVIAREIIKLGGVVCGATIDENMQVYHVVAKTLDELELIRGSKYVQSALGDCYREIRRILKSGQWVYFTGTGCQVAGLKTFLRKDYANLLTSDLICHGVPNQRLFDMHIKYLEKKHNGKVIAYQFRDNKNWRVNELVTMVIGSQTRFFRLPTYEFSPYLYSFMFAMIYRYSCYKCPFAKVTRQGDITLADFWGIHHFFPNMDARHGVSLVLLNTDKGIDFWKKIHSYVYSEEANISSAAQFNGNLVRSTVMPLIRETIFSKIKMEGYNAIACTLFRPKKYNFIKIKAFLRNILDKLG